MFDAFHYLQKEPEEGLPGAVGHDLRREEELKRNLILCLKPTSLWITHNVLKETHVPESVERRGEEGVAEDDPVAKGPEHEAAEDDPDGALMSTTDIFGQN